MLFFWGMLAANFLNFSTACATSISGTSLMELDIWFRIAIEAILMVLYPWMDESYRSFRYWQGFYADLPSKDTMDNKSERKCAPGTCSSCSEFGSINVRHDGHQSWLILPRLFGRSMRNLNWTDTTEWPVSICFVGCFDLLVILILCISRMECHISLWSEAWWCVRGKLRSPKMILFTVMDGDLYVDLSR